MYYITTYNGQFGFIKPWTAVRDGTTFSQQFLTPSIIEGIRQKLEVERIARHRLTFKNIALQQEVTQTRGWEYNSRKKAWIRKRSIIYRGVLIEPTLYLAFESETDAQKACKQHICLCRNEDILLPDEEIKQMTGEEFDLIAGFELRFEKNENSFMVGYNRFNNNKPMYGWLYVTEKPLKVYEQI